MIYLSIPKGMEYKPIVHDKVARDYFIDPLHKRPSIDLQGLVKEALRENSGRKKVIRLAEFTIYIRVPPNNNELFLQYHPNNNGRFATTAEAHLIRGCMAQRFQPQLQTRYGGFWDANCHMTSKKKQEILEKRKEQKQDRRHVGDSPKPT